MMSRLPIHNHRSESQAPRLRKGGTPKAVRQLVDVLRRLYDEHLTDIPASEALGAIKSVEELDADKVHDGTW